MTGGETLIYTELTNKAMKLAYDSHAGQLDAGGTPYIFHPYHLAEQMDTEKRVCIALLHDVVEDTHVTLKQIQERFPAEIAGPVALLTHDPKENYYDYIKKVCADRDACFVKIADLLHNMTEARVKGCGVEEKDKNRWHEKYMKALYFVVNAIEEGVSGPCKDQTLLNRLLESFPGRARKNILIHLDQGQQQYLNPCQIETLQDKPVEEQLKYFQVEYAESREGSAEEDYQRTKTCSLEEALHENRTLFSAEGCIVGFMDICCHTDCKRKVMPVFVNGQPRMVRQTSYLDHGRAVSETKSLKLLWNDAAD